MNTSVNCENQLFESAEINVTDGIDVVYHLYRRVDGDITVYSIEVITLGKGELERKYADSVTTLTDEAEGIFTFLIEGKVTACTLYDVLADIL